MTQKAEDFFSAEENERIRREVETAESHTSGEIAVMLVDKSDSYREAEILAAFLLAALFAMICAVAAGFDGMWHYIPLVALFFLPAKYLAGMYPQMGLSFLGRRRLAEAVRERAERGFFERGLYRTRDETGVLIFISILERKVWILGDRGINTKIPPEGWKHLADQLATGLRENRACDALCSVIAQCGEEL
ncbi:MAG: TPM domain-containing protein, partial [Syntrophobacteraceae bacterium]